MGLFELTTHHTISINQADSADIIKIAHLLEENNLPASSSDEHVSFLTAKRDGTLLGCIGWECYGDCALLRSLAVDSSSRKKGIGQQLVRAAISQLAAEGTNAFYLLTNDASDFALRLGFKLTSRCSLPPSLSGSKQFASNCCASAQCMELKLVPAGEAR